MKKLNALALHNFFCNEYKRSFAREYEYQGKGMELVLLKRVLKDYDYFQLVRAIQEYLDLAVAASVREFYYRCEDLVRENAPDILEAKARYAIKLKKKNARALRDAYYGYLDAQDAWLRKKSTIDTAAKRLEELVDGCLNLQSE